MRFLYDYFSELATANEFLEQAHPNYHDAKTTIQAYYLLNDIMLRIMLGDKSEKEINVLTVMLEHLSTKFGNTINISALRNKICKIGVEQEKESGIEECRSRFRKQLEDLKKRKQVVSSNLYILFHLRFLFYCMLRKSLD